MIQTLLRRPDTGEAVADAVRLLGTATIVVAAIGWDLRDALSIAVAALVTLVPRLLGVRPSVDIAFGVVTLVAAWSAVLALYETARWWDLPIHFALNALVAALAYVLLVRLRVIADAEDLPRPMVSAAVTTTAIGLAFGVLWELLEWFVKNYVDSGTFVGYDDTLGDLVVGGLGALAAGCGMRYLAGDSRAVEDDREEQGARGGT